VQRSILGYSVVGIFMMALSRSSKRLQTISMYRESPFAFADLSTDLRIRVFQFWMPRRSASVPVPRSDSPSLQAKTTCGKPKEIYKIDSPIFLNEL
jgi:hypothetical protein